MKTAILRNIHTNDVYRHISGNKFRNVRTGKEGEVDPEKANTVFRINLELTDFCNRYEIVEEFINRLQLKISL